MTAPFAWHSLRTLLPAEWELTTYEKDPLRGRIEFSTLDGLMASLDWAPAKRKQRRDLWEREERSDGSLTAVSARSADERSWTWTFSPAARTAADTVIQACADLPEGVQEYTLHGIHARMPASFSLAAVSAYPANILLGFEDQRRQRVVFRRWGLPDHLLRGETPENFFVHLLENERFRIENARAKSFRGHKAVRVIFSAPGLTPLARLRLRRARGRGWIWRDAAANRLLTFEQLAADEAGWIDPDHCFGS